MKGFVSLLKKDARLMISGKFFLMSFGFLILYTFYVNFGYVKLMNAGGYQAYLYDPEETQKAASSLIQRVSSEEELKAALLGDENGVGILAGNGELRVLCMGGTKKSCRYQADYAGSLLHPAKEYNARIIGFQTPEQKARKDITCELLFFEMIAVGFLGIAAVLFKEKGMGVIRVHGILPVKRNCFLLSKLTVFLASDLVFAGLLTLFNVGLPDTAAILPGVLIQTALLSIIMALSGVICALLLKDFRQFTLAYLLITIFAATPVFMSANTPIKLEWIRFHPFYIIYMGVKNAYFGTPENNLIYYLGCLTVIGALFAAAMYVFGREMRKER